MISDTQRLQLYERAAVAFRQQDTSGWRFAMLASCTDRTYKDLADYIGGVSVDKIESHAHAWQMYRALRAQYGGVVGAIRRLPYVYLSHFLALHRIQRKHGLELSALWSYLQDVCQAEGGISSRDLMTQADREHGAERALPWEADKARSALARVLSRGDIDASGRKKLQEAHDLLAQYSQG